MSQLNTFLDLGHKQIACITTPMSSSTGQKRLSAYKETLIKHDIEVNDGLVYEGQSNPESGYDATIKLIDSGIPFSAIFRVLTPWPSVQFVHCMTKD